MSTESGTPTTKNYASQMALDAFHAGGGFIYPFRHGYEALKDLLDDMAPDEWRRDEEVLGALMLYLVKYGQAARAYSYLKAEKLGFEKTYLYALLELLLDLHMGVPVSQRKLTSWRRLERELPLSDPLMMGLYYNAMLAIHVRLGRVEDARITGQKAISCYREDGHIYLEHYIHVHLADLHVTAGRLNDAEARLGIAKRCLAESGTIYGNETDLMEIVELAIHFERGDLDKVCQDSARLRHSLVSGDSWAELFYQLARISVLSRYFLEGRRAALQELEHFQADFARRHGGVSYSLDVLNAWIWHLEWNPNEAERIATDIQGIDMQSNIGMVLLSELLSAQGHAAEKPQPEAPRTAIIEALRTARETTGARRHMAFEQAISLALPDKIIAPFLENRDLFLTGAKSLSRSGFVRRDRRRSYLVSQIIKQVEQSYVVPNALSKVGFSRRHYRVASALQSGAKNKQIARQMGTTEATVKYHLTSIFRMTGTTKRNELIDYMDQFATD